MAEDGLINRLPVGTVISIENPDWGEFEWSKTGDEFLVNMRADIPITARFKINLRTGKLSQLVIIGQEK